MPNIAVPTEDGYFVTEDQQRIAEIIKDYDPYLELVWIPPDKRDPTDDKPFAVVHHPPHRPSYYVKFFETCDQRILEYLWTHDNTRTNVLNDLDAKNAAWEALEMKRKMDEMDEARDLAEHMIKTPLNTYTYRDKNGIKQKLVQRGGHDK